MPPEKAPRQPLPHDRRAVVEWIADVHEHEARRNAGDPGAVLARRLSNAEFDYTIRDLTGVDIRPTREFPVDPANEAGFDNSGESLTMSPALVKKYLAAARLVADHLVLKPEGFGFAPHPVVTDTDRDKYCVARIIDFYQRQRVDYADYFLAAWRFQHRAALGKPDAPLGDFAGEAGISARYLATIWSILQRTLAGIRSAGQSAGAVAGIAGRCRRRRTRPGAAASGSRDFVVALARRGSSRRWSRCRCKGISAGSQPFVLWKNRQLAAQRMRYPGGRAQRATSRSFAGSFPTPSSCPSVPLTSIAKGRQERAAADRRLPPDEATSATTRRSTS